MYEKMTITMTCMEEKTPSSIQTYFKSRIFSLIVYRKKSKEIY